MTRITDGKKLIEVYMGNWIEGSGYGIDVTGDLLGIDYVRYDDEHEAIVISSTVEEFIAWAYEWRRGEDEWTRETMMEFAGTDGEETIRREIESRAVEISEPIDI